MALSPFDVARDLCYDKKCLLNDDNEGEYPAFMVNKALSYYTDTVLLTNEMNMMGHLDKRLQHDFLMHTILKRKRYSKWVKRETTERVKLLSEYFGSTYRYAKSVMGVLSETIVDDLVAVAKKRRDAEK